MKNPNGPSREEREQWADTIADQESERLLSPAPSSASPLDDPGYQAFVEEMAKLCKCTPLSDRPCDGLLAGGPCDDMHTDENNGCCDGAREDYFCGE